MKLTTMTQITIDGVVQGNGGASDEDRRSGFERGGWARGRGAKETIAFINETYQRADAFLLGRRTYEVFAAVWGSLKEQIRERQLAEVTDGVTRVLGRPPKPFAQWARDHAAAFR